MKKCDFGTNRECLRMWQKVNIGQLRVKCDHMMELYSTDDMQELDMKMDKTRRKMTKDSKNDIFQQVVGFQPAIVEFQPAIVEFRPAIAGFRPSTTISDHPMGLPHHPSHTVSPHLADIFILWFLKFIMLPSMIWW